MKIGICGDSHFGIRGGDPDFLEFQLKWNEKMLSKARDMGIKKIIQAGDMLDVRKVLDVRVGNALSNRFLPMLEKYDIMWETIVGNHNCYFRDSNQTHNLWFLEQTSDRFKVVVENEYDPETKIQYLSWINKNNIEDQMKIVADTSAKYLIAHLELSDFPLMAGVIAKHGQDPKLFSKFDRVLSGHYHQKNEIGNVTMLGSPYHLNWGDYPDGINRGWFVFDTDTGSLELIKNDEDDTLFAVHYYDPEHKYTPEDLQKYNGKIVRYVVKDKGATRSYTKFLEAVRQVKPIDYSIIDETIVKKSDKTEQKFDPSKMLTNMSQIVVDYSSKLAETVPGADVNVTKQITIDLYQKANQ